MKYCLSSSLVLATLVTTQALSLITPVNAQQIPAPVANGILHPRESSFFREGREKFEKEIRFLFRNSRSPLEVPLKINREQTQIRRQRSLFDNPLNLPDNKVPSD
ncbi:hypothetical protein LC593_15405 [Nostoc sp. CHAB 5844]|nr:hypothetical protein [Nostoc sp. CHAB 5844]